MEHSETLTSYDGPLPFADPGHPSPGNAVPEHFNVFERRKSGKGASFTGRYFYQVSLILSTGKLHYAHKRVAVDRPAFLLSSPLIPYSWEADSPEEEGWSCVFTPDFIRPLYFKQLIGESPFFNAGGEHIFFMDPEQLEFIAGVFKRMTQIQSGNPPNDDLLRNYLYLLICEASDMKPAAH